METTTDYIVLFFCIIFFFNGWRRGLFLTILGPIALLGGALAGIIYYYQTSNLAIALAISILGPFIIKLALFWIFKFINTDPPNKKSISFTSRISAGVISIFWSSIMLALSLLFITILPSPFPWLTKSQEDIKASVSYKIINALTGQKVTKTTRDIENVKAFFEDPKRIEKLHSTKEFKALATDKKVQAIMEDDETVRQIQEKDIMSLMQNPKIKEILKDEELLKKFLEVNKVLLKQNYSLRSK